METSKKIRLVSLIGIVLSLYAVYVESKHKADPTFEALCDFSTWGISCSKVFASPYGHLFFGVPNAVFGALFYFCAVASTVATFVPFRKELLFAACSFSVAITLYLATCLYALGDFCIVCAATYVLNIYLVPLSWQYMKTASKAKNS